MRRGWNNEKKRAVEQQNGLFLFNLNLELTATKEKWETAAEYPDTIGMHYCLYCGERYECESNFSVTYSFFCLLVTCKWIGQVHRCLPGRSQCPSQTGWGKFNVIFLRRLFSFLWSIFTSESNLSNSISKLKLKATSTINGEVVYSRQDNRATWLYEVFFVKSSFLQTDINEVVLW
jgi:hypothetical protein